MIYLTTLGNYLQSILGRFDGNAMCIRESTESVCLVWYYVYFLFAVLVLEYSIEVKLPCLLVLFYYPTTGQLRVFA
jgi:hypothetical protein